MKLMRHLFFIAALACMCAQASAQVSGAGQLSCSGSTVTGTAVTSATSNNTVLATLTNTPAYAVLVQLDQGTTITGGAFSFQYSKDGTANYINVPVTQVLVPTTGAQLTNPYTLVGSTNQEFLVVLAGASNFQVKLTTTMTGTGTITPYLTPLCAPPALGPLLLDANGNLKININAQSLGKVLVTPDSVALPANQSVNEAQVNGVTPLMGNGVSGTGSQRVNIASDNSALPAAGQGATGSAVPSGATYAGGNGSGNLTGIISCDNSAAINMSTATTTQIIAISGTGGRTYVCAIHLVVSAADNVALISGSGTNCASNQAGLAGGTTAASGWNFAANGGLSWGSGLGMVIKTATTNNEICLVTSASAQVSGTISYTQF